MGAARGEVPSDSYARASGCKRFEPSGEYAEVKRVLVTGGSGFIAANLARRLLSVGHDVHLMTRTGSSLWRIEPLLGSLHLHPLDAGDVERVSRLIEAVRPEWVFHLAAHGAYPHQRDRDRMLSTNLLFTMSLLDACVQVGFETFVNAGSSSEYGSKDHAPGEEESLDPTSLYGVTKAAASIYCGFVARRSKANVCTLRLYSVFGPFEDSARLMPRIILSGLARTLPPLARPDRAHDFIYVGDVVDAFLKAANEPGHEAGAIYNVGTGIQISLKEVVDTATEHFGLEAQPVWGSMPDREWDTPVWVADNRKIRERIGWKPTRSFKQGFVELVEWFRANLHLYQERNEDLTRP